MINLEFYKDEFVHMLKDEYYPPLCNYFKKIRPYTNCPDCPFCTKDETICDYQKFVDWLLEEHKEPIKLKQWEKDLLGMSYVETRFKHVDVLDNMKDMGYFKGVTDTSMTIGEILDNCEVID